MTFKSVKGSSLRHPSTLHTERGCSVLIILHFSLYSPNSHCILVPTFLSQSSPPPFPPSLLTRWPGNRTPTTNPQLLLLF
ncbi:hypothetical protein VNO77_07513 [Canavalia gladiata]|uniref:Uncharacterized protein n=1 Tax=Canavalia gladiata TaxID=3824 RepID=A0AAN9MBI4_CANGL